MPEKVYSPHLHQSQEDFHPIVVRDFDNEVLQSDALRRRKRVEILNLLLEKGANVNKVRNMANKKFSSN